MSGECEKCTEHTLECRCKTQGMTKIRIAKLHDAIHKMNLVITQGERNAVNRHHYLLWQIADMIQEISHYPSMGKHPLAPLAQQLKDLVNIFPVLSK